MDYVIQGTRFDGTIAELFRTGNVTEATEQFDKQPKYSYEKVKLIQELRTK